MIIEGRRKLMESCYLIRPDWQDADSVMQMVQEWRACGGQNESEITAQSARRLCRLDEDTSEFGTEK